MTMPGLWQRPLTFQEDPCQRASFPNKLKKPGSRLHRQSELNLLKATRPGGR